MFIGNLSILYSEHLYSQYVFLCLALSSQRSIYGRHLTRGPLLYCSHSYVSRIVSAHSFSCAYPQESCLRSSHWKRCKPGNSHTQYTPRSGNGSALSSIETGLRSTGAYRGDKEASPVRTSIPPRATCPN